MQTIPAVIFFLIITIFPAHADATCLHAIKPEQISDNARDADLSGPDYEIRAENGEPVQANLFHRFRQFDIASDESVTFAGPDSVRNIIVFVSGEGSSRIEGRLCSAIPDADLYLLNPSGVSFGADASLSLGGSLHVSTANYLRMGEKGRFPSDSPSGKPMAFGFSDKDVAPITFEGRIHGDGDGEEGGLAVSEGETISVVGGNIAIRKGSYSPMHSKRGQFRLILECQNLRAPGGRIHLVSVSSEGEAAFTLSGMDCSSFEKLGEIALSDKSVINAGGSKAGSIFIRGDRFVSNNSLVLTTNEGEKNDRDKPGRIDIEARQIMLDRARIHSSAYGSAYGGTIVIKAEEMMMMNDESDISGGTLGPGDSGDVLIEVKGILTISGGCVFAGTTSEGPDAGKAGKIEIKARQILLIRGPQIESSTSGPADGGTIVIKAEEVLSASGKNLYKTGSNIWVRSFSEKKDAGNAGHIRIEAGRINLSDGAIIDSSAHFGHGGTIVIRADTLTASEGGVFTSSDEGWAGEIDMKVRKITLNKGARIDSGMMFMLLRLFLAPLFHFF